VLDEQTRLNMEALFARTEREHLAEAEAVTRQLIEAMRLEKDQSLTLEEKPERAQQLNNRPHRGARPAKLRVE
jgi:hypothetical protein